MIERKDGLTVPRAEAGLRGNSFKHTGHITPNLDAARVSGLRAAPARPEMELWSYRDLQSANTSASYTPPGGLFTLIKEY